MSYMQLVAQLPHLAVFCRDHWLGLSALLLMFLQVMQVWNKLLDKSSELRDQLGPGADALSLQASLNGLWQRAQRRLDGGQQQQGSNGLQHSVMNGDLQPHGAPHPQHSQQQGQLAIMYNASQARDLLMQWHMANIEFANAAQLRCLSMLHWDLDDMYEHQGAHVFLPGQMGSVYVTTAALQPMS